MRATVPLETISTLRLPAHISWNDRGAAVTWLAERSAANVIALQLVARRAREVLRFQQGVVYDIRTDYEILDGNTAHCTLAADCQPEHVQGVAAEFLKSIAGLSRDGPEADELADQVNGFLQHTTLSQSRLGFLDGAAFGQVIGKPEKEPGAIIEEYRTLAPDGVAAALAAALPSMLVGAAGQRPSNPWAGAMEFSAYPMTSNRSVAGRTFGPPGLRLPGRGRQDRLTVGDEGVTYRAADGSLSTVLYAECVACRHWEGDVRQLWSRDGFTVHIDPSQWRDGKMASAMVDAAVQPAVVVCDEHGVGALEDPADQGRPAAAEAASPAP